MKKKQTQLQRINERKIKQTKAAWCFEREIREYVYRVYNFLVDCYLLLQKESTWLNVCIMPTRRKYWFLLFMHFFYLMKSNIFSQIFFIHSDIARRTTTRISSTEQKSQQSRTIALVLCILYAHCKQACLVIAWHTIMRRSHVSCLG